MSHRRFVSFASTLIVLATLAAPLRAESTPAQRVGTRAHREAILDRIYDHLAREQPGPILAAVSPDVVWWMNGRKTDVIPFAGVYEGKSGVARFLTSFFSELEIQAVNRQLVVMQGDLAVAHVELVARVERTGKTLALELAQSWQFDRNDHVVAFHGFHDTWSLWRAFQPGDEAIVVDRRAGTDYAVRPVEFDAAAVVMSGYQAFFSNDVAAALAIMAPEAVWMLKGDERVPYVGTFVGPLGLLDFFQKMLAVAAYTAMPSFPYVVSEGNRVDVYIIEPQVSLATGERSVCHIIHSYTLDDTGHVTEMKSYNDSYEIHAVFGPAD